MAVSKESRRHQAIAAHRRLLPDLTLEALTRLGRAESVAFEARLDQQLLDIYEPLAELYGADHDVPALFDRLVRSALDAVDQRPVELRELDRRREIDPHWYQRARNIGYVCYVDRFCGSLAALPDNLDYLAELGVTYLHLMPLLKPRLGENDGGYAVMDYRSVDPRLGTMDDLETAARALRERGMSLCIDLVLNHTAQEHAWAEGWLSGDPAYADFYTAFGDRTMPDAYERTIMEVFPDRAPGSFTWFAAANGGAGGWVWTTFWSYQWDLNYANPNVLVAMLETILWLANRGVEIFRMDAVPFMWKRMGTSCMNQPEAHTLMQVLHALVKLAAPGVIFKAEAIVAPDELVPYLGGHDRYRPECELAYHNQLMVMLWSSLATGDARLATQSLRRMRPIPADTSWVTYVRCHDDIGWAVDDSDAAAVGFNGFEHRRFLNDFYAGRYFGSFARGALFQENPATGDARISGSAASLCGIDQALAMDDAAGLEQATRRFVVLHAVIYAFGGVPLLYMGDELALRNDDGYLKDPALADDNRWMHRPVMDWAAAQRRNDPDTLENSIFGWIRRLGEARKATLALRTGGESEVFDSGDGRVLAWRRRHPRSGTFVGLVNFATEDVWLDGARFALAGTKDGDGPQLQTLLSSDGPPELSNGWVRLPGLGFLWLLDP
ncbi:MAG TPA: alpha-amylase family protein [Kineosporiaceae bacterium]|nr:alpha-amylase family protein [Kineosporiaceae bacterium]